jgi:antirestriction protein ArdC
MTTVYEKHAQEVADFFIQGLKDGTSKYLKPWNSSTIDATPYNPTTGKAYRGSNIMALEVQQQRLAAKGADLDDQRWMTYKQAMGVGAQVRKGEKATALVTWVERKNPSKEAQKIGDDEVSSRRLMCMPFAVFHASQIDGLPERVKLVERPLDERLALARELVEQTGAVINHGGSEAYYNRSTDQIQLPSREAFRDDASHMAVALHELSHWSGASTRLDRKFGSFGNPDYAKDELRAELSSYSMCQRLGVPYDPSQHQAYVNSWITVLQNDPKELLRAASDSEKILTFLKVPERTYEILPQIERKQEQAADIRQELTPIMEVEVAMPEPKIAKRRGRVR